jgi:hypothetical protein
MGACGKEAARSADGEGYALFGVGPNAVPATTNNRPAGHTDLDVPLEDSTVAREITGSDAPAAHQPHGDNDQGHDQQEMDQSARYAHRKAENPQNQQHEDEGPQHAELPPAATVAACLSRASRMPRVS